MDPSAQSASEASHFVDAEQRRTRAWEKIFKTQTPQTSLEHLEFGLNLGQARKPVAQQKQDLIDRAMQSVIAHVGMVHSAGFASRQTVPHDPTDITKHMIKESVVLGLSVATDEINYQINGRHSEKMSADNFRLAQERPGFLLEPLSVPETISQHGWAVYGALKDGAFDNSPVLKLRAIEAVAKAYIDQKLVFGDPWQEFSDPSHVLDHFRIMLSRTLQVIGPFHPGDRPLTQEEEITLGWVRGMIELKVIGDQRPNVVDFIDHEYVPSLECIQGGLGENFLTRREEVNAVRALLCEDRPNVPPSALKRAYDKIRERFEPVFNVREQENGSADIQPLGKNLE